MAPQKRKYLDAGLEPSNPPGATRRKTRQHPGEGAERELAFHKLRSGLIRVPTTQPAPDPEPAATRPASRGKESVASSKEAIEAPSVTASRQPRRTRPGSRGKEDEVPKEPIEAPTLVLSTRQTKATRPGSRGTESDAVKEPIPNATSTTTAPKQPRSTRPASRGKDSEAPKESVEAIGLAASRQPRLARPASRGKDSEAPKESVDVPGLAASRQPRSTRPASRGKDGDAPEESVDSIGLAASRQPRSTRPASRGKDSEAPKESVDAIGLAASRQPRSTRLKRTTEKAEADEDELVEIARPLSPPPVKKRRAAAPKKPQPKKSESKQSEPKRAEVKQSEPKQSQSKQPLDEQPPPTADGSSHSLVESKTRSAESHKAMNKPSSELSRPIPAATGSGRAPPAGTSSITPKRSSANKPKTPKHPGTPCAERNIDKVIFGTRCFKAWYPSYYGKEVIGDLANNGAAANPKIGGGKRAPPMLDRLYICPCCFKYSRDMEPWYRHVRFCEKKFSIPGTKIYTHPQHSETVKVPKHNSTPLSKGGEWSIWEVDGEKKKLFCQNLSLFAKLFLDNKSVFFDVAGFNYFLLVYTPPQSEDQSVPSTQGDSVADPEDLAQSAPESNSVPNNSRPQIVGFFSKEKMSWDNNNLACILVFPPWQRKGLGALLMGVSYEISKREGILGGPEKPISELGRKGYKRFWSGEIVRWLLNLPTPPTQNSDASRPAAKEGDKSKNKSAELEDYMVDVERCSLDTWIVAEDCLAILREMAIVEEAGLGPPLPVRRPETDGDTNILKEKEKDSKENLVSRVRVNKDVVRAWAHENRIDLTLTCDPLGFVPGYATKKRVPLPDGEE